MRKLEKKNVNSASVKLYISKDAERILKNQEAQEIVENTWLQAHINSIKCHALRVQGLNAINPESISIINKAFQQISEDVEAIKWRLAL